jgi:hypothetical protein
MRCETARERLRECLDGQLPPPVKAHLDGCASCRVEWVWLRQVDDALATLPLSEEPADFTARVMAQVQTAEANRPPVLSPASKLAHILRWEDAVMSFAFAWAIMAPRTGSDVAHATNTAALRRVGSVESVRGGGGGAECLRVVAKVAVAQTLERPAVMIPIVLFATLVRIFRVSKRPQHQRVIVPSKAEGIGQHHLQFYLACLVGHVIQIAGRIGPLLVNRRRDQAGAQRLDANDGL